MPDKGDIVVRTEFHLNARFQREGEIYECVKDRPKIALYGEMGTYDFRPATEEEITWFKRGMTNINQPRLKVGDRVRVGEVEKDWHGYTKGLSSLAGPEARVRSLENQSICLDNNYSLPLYALTKIEEFKEGDIVTIISGKSYGLWIEENEIFELGGEFWDRNGYLKGITRRYPKGNGGWEKMEGFIRHCTPEEIEHFNKAGRGAKTTDVAKRIVSNNYSKNKSEKDENVHADSVNELGGNRGKGNVAKHEKKCNTIKSRLRGNANRDRGHRARVIYSTQKESLGLQRN